MSKKAFAIVALLFLVGVNGSLQDGKSVVDEAARAIGAAGVKSIQYSGSGFVYAFGQNPTPYSRYPKFFAKYSRVVDYEKGAAREETARTQFENPPHGGGQQPIYREARGAAVVGPSSAWGGGALALTPHGWVKAAMAASPTMKSATLNGKPVKVVSFVMNGKNKVDGYLDGQNLLQKIDTWTANPILGDMLIETTFADYKDFGGIKFPTKLAQSQGGFPVMEITVNDVKPNAPMPDVKLPGPPAAARADAQKVAEGVWYLEGTPDPNSMAVEFKDFVVTIESSVSEGRAVANIETVKKLVPGKPIRYHLNSHHHSDHAAGLRANVAEGITIITHESNKQFYEQTVLKAPHALDPDRLTQNPKAAKFIWVKDKYVVTDGTRNLEIYYIRGAGHADNMLMSYLPKEKILFITDIFNQFGEPRPNDPPPGIVSPYYGALRDNLARLKLDPAQLAPSHGKGVVPIDVFTKTIQGTVQPPQIVVPTGN